MVKVFSSIQSKQDENTKWQFTKVLYIRLLSLTQQSLSRNHAHNDKTDAGVQPRATQQQTHMTEACDKYSHPSFPTLSISSGVCVLKSLLSFLNNQCWMEPFQFTQHVAKWLKRSIMTIVRRPLGSSAILLILSPATAMLHTSKEMRTEVTSVLFTLKTDAKALGQYQWTVWDQKEVGFTPKQKMNAQR